MKEKLLFILLIIGLLLSFSIIGSALHNDSKLLPGLNAVDINSLVGGKVAPKKVKYWCVYWDGMDLGGNHCYTMAVNCLEIYCKKYIVPDD